MSVNYNNILDIGGLVPQSMSNVFVVSMTPCNMQTRRGLLCTAGMQNMVREDLTCPSFCMRVQRSSMSAPHWPAACTHAWAYWPATEFRRFREEPFSSHSFCQAASFRGGGVMKMTLSAVTPTDTRYLAISLRLSEYSCNGTCCFGFLSGKTRNNISCSIFLQQHKAFYRRLWH